MEKGYMQNLHADELITTNDYMWLLAMIGKTTVSGFLSKWDNVSNSYAYKKGVIHKPNMSVSEYENGSFFKELLDNLMVSAVNLGPPVIVDIFDPPSGSPQMSYDNLLTYGTYIKQNWGLNKKPILRASMGLWNGWVSNHPGTIADLLDKFDILAAQWQVIKPDNWAEIGTPKWWEYKEGLIAHDLTGQWVTLTSDYVPPVEDPDDPETPPAEIPTVSGKWKSTFPPLWSLLGGEVIHEPVNEE